MISHRFEVRIQIGTDYNMKEGEAMQNVEWEIKDDKLIIEIDLTKDFGPSKSGKTITIASTRGNQKVEGTDAIIGLNVYKYPESV
jgi:hypothetical protein